MFGAVAVFHAMICVIIFMQDLVFLSFLSEMATNYASHNSSPCILYSVALHKTLTVRNITHFKNFNFFFHQMQLKYTSMSLYNLIRTQHYSVSKTWITVLTFCSYSIAFIQLLDNKDSDYQPTEVIVP